MAAERCQPYEQVFYGLENGAVLVDADGRQPFVEGDMVHVPAEHAYHVVNEGETWMSYLIMSA